MRERIICTFLAMWLWANLFGAILYHDQAPFESQPRLDSLYNQCLIIRDSLTRLHYKVVQMEIFEIAGRPYLVIDGRMNVFGFENNVWRDMSKSLYHGYNYFSKKFVLNGDIYSYGGYGFWRQHGDLIKFDWDRREWEAIPMKIDHDIGNGISFVSNDTLYVIKPQFKNQTVTGGSADDNLYKINTTNGVIHRHRCDLIPSLREGALLIETPGFLLIFNEPIYMIDKFNMSYKIPELSYMQALNSVEPSSLIVLHSDTMLYWNNITAPEPVRYDLSQQYVKMDGVIKPLIASKTFSYWLFLLLLIFPLAFMFARKKNLVKPRQLSHPLINKLVSYAGKTLDTDQLDRIFGIESIIPAETQRHKRASLINEINLEYHSTYGSDLIHRIQDKEDKRRFLYKIISL